jgi:hypothetical protein
MELKIHKKKSIKDQAIESIGEKEEYPRHEFLRVYAIDTVFQGVIFKQSNFLSCYFRKCRFINCDFTGAIFKETNLLNSQFENCKFDYSFWDKTIVDEKILDSCLPSEENLARDLVRSLRVNFSQIGNYDAVNKAAAIEVKLTGKHLYNAAYSKQSYYRAKYKGRDRFQVGCKHAWWKALDLLWGNGESIFRVVVCGLLVIALVAVILIIKYQFSLCDSMWTATCVFWGVKPTHEVPQDLHLLSTVIRYFLFGLFMAILVKRLARR